MSEKIKVQEGQPRQIIVGHRKRPTPVLRIAAARPCSEAVRAAGRLPLGGMAEGGAQLRKLGPAP
ncbi:hypothetical protein, partial [Streptomyces sp. NPDC059649]|uniref:hypothetical protein n=1 Tax=Streptomyces sp. NPDC059649 TaxID=3346895 RepID=UPI0036CBEB70